MKTQYNYSGLTNQELVTTLKTHVADERKAQAVYLACLAEIEDRMLYAELGYSSLFSYCVRELGFSEGATHKRICAARAARKFSIIYALIEEGEIHLTAVSLLSGLLTEDNHQEVLKQACGKTKKEIELLVAKLTPQLETKDFIRTIPQVKLEVTSPGESNHEAEKAITAQQPLPPPKPEIIKPITEERVVFKFTGSVALRRKLERAKEILRHKCPQGKLEDIIDEALEVLLEKKDPERRIAKKKKHEPCQSPALLGREANPKDLRSIIKKARASSSSRKVPQSIKNHVWMRDQGRCQYVSPDGKCCHEKAWLEFDHIQPWAYGGASHDPQNIRLLCRTHNQLAAAKIFGMLQRHHA